MQASALESDALRVPRVRAVSGVLFMYRLARCYHLVRNNAEWSIENSRERSRARWISRRCLLTGAYRDPGSRWRALGSSRYPAWYPRRVYHRPAASRNQSPQGWRVSTARRCAAGLRRPRGFVRFRLRCWCPRVLNRHHRRLSNNNNINDNSSITAIDNGTKPAHRWWDPPLSFYRPRWPIPPVCIYWRTTT